MNIKYNSAMAPTIVIKEKTIIGFEDNPDEIKRLIAV